MIEKRYIAVIPLQEHLKQVKYDVDDSSQLAYDKKTGFPIMQVIAATAKKLDHITIELVMIEHPCVDNNFIIFQKELDLLRKELEFEYQLTVVKTVYKESIDSHLKLFCDLIEEIQDNEYLYACITFGNKPIPIIINMALEYAHKIKKNIQIEHIVYGQFDHTTGKAKLFDTTALFYMNSIVNKLSELKIKQPEQMLRMMLDLN